MDIGTGTTSTLWAVYTDIGPVSMGPKATPRLRPSMSMGDRIGELIGIGDGVAGLEVMLE